MRKLQSCLDMWPIMFTLFQAFFKVQTNASLFRLSLSFKRKINVNNCTISESVALKLWKTLLYLSSNTWRTMQYCKFYENIYYTYHQILEEQCNIANFWLWRFQEFATLTHFSFRIYDWRIFSGYFYDLFFWIDTIYSIDFILHSLFSISIRAAENLRKSLIFYE